MPATTRCRSANLASSSARISATRKSVEPNRYQRSYKSRGSLRARSLKASGKFFVGRYAVNDKSPGGRGIGGAEYAAMRDAGIDTFLYWESSEGWMTGGYNAGVSAAQNAQMNIVNAGIPTATPVYFACDFDAEPSDQAAIDQCLAGAASVLGFNRVGLYAGYHVLLRSKQNKACQWFCQTSAWSGGMVMEGTHLYQYDYNKYIYGTNCDWVRAYADNYGQAIPPAPPKPAYPTPRPVPDALLKGQDHTDAKGNVWYAVHRTVNVVEGTKFYINASTRSKQADAPAPKGGKAVKIVGRVNAWYVMEDGKSFMIKQADVNVSFKRK